VLNRALFKTYDKDNSGDISYDELYMATRQEKVFGIGPEKVKHALERFDQNGDGKIDLYEFCMVMGQALADSA